MEIDDDFFLSLAINEAWKYQGLTYPNPAVGCTIVDKNGALLSVEAHEKSGEAHAELKAVKSALQKLNPNFIFPKDANKLHHFILQNHQNLLQNAHIFVTLEPCSHQGKTPSCATLLQSLHVKRVAIGTKDTNKEASGGAMMLKNAQIQVDFSPLEDKCKELLEPFYAWKDSNFSFFKLALSVNGVYDGGIITCKDSRVLVHKLRDRCDLLVTGGNTVRVDNPTLDARLCKGKAPDILIYSKKEDFNPSTPLFHVQNRSVHVSQTPKLTKNYNFIMYEGAQGLLKAVQNKVNWFLIFHSPHFKIGKSIKLEHKLQMMWQGTVGSDRYGWYKRVN